VKVVKREEFDYVEYEGDERTFPFMLKDKVKRLG